MLLTPTSSDITFCVPELGVLCILVQYKFIVLF